MVYRWLEQFTEKAESHLGRHEWRWVLSFTGVLLLLALAVDLREKMWLDELYTFYTASQANPLEVIRSSMEGTDGMPPLYSMLANPLLHVSPVEALALRLPSTLGYCCMVIFLYGFCRRRLTVSYAMAATALACFINIYYASQARGYGVALGCIAGALYSWQLAAEGKDRRRNLALLAFFLMLMTAMQYYSIFVMVPLFAGEVIRARLTRRIDVPILLTGLGPLLVLAVHYPLIQAAKRLQVHFWAKASWQNIPEFYVSRSFPLPLLALVALLLIAVFPLDTSALRGPEDRKLTAYEWVMLVGLTLLPVLVVGVSMFTTHVFVERYVCWALIGCTILFTAVVQSAARSVPITGLMILVAAVGLTGLHEIYHLVQSSPVDKAVARLSMLPDSSEPIIVAHPALYLEMAYYTPPRLQGRITYILSEELDLKYWNHDSDALLLHALQSRTKLHILDYSKLADYSHFLLLANTWSYLPKHLEAAGYTLKPVTPETTPTTLFEVQAPLVAGQLR